MNYCKRGMQEKGRKGERGITVVELAFAMASSVVIVLATVGVSQSVSSSSTELVTGFESLRGNLEAIDKLRVHLARSKIVEIGDHGTSITFALPIRGKEDNSILAEDGEIRWGISDRMGIRKDGYCKVVFKPKKKLIEGEIDKDLNGDGDKEDVFHVGRLKLVTDESDELGLKEIVVVLAGANMGGDVDGDGVDDPLFSINVHNVVTIRLTRLLRDGGTRQRVIRVRPIASEVQR